ncbi:threonine ammonia-lyase [Brevibacillus ruminantium]|uniref:L-threonine dehydratase catabolic TdcB n=1 Tax=Brevibacillus ruminantium TaxID=2950604 RepID=A0ABY4WMA7_9BACL|nr:threonine ammonia-lyase [Brevibacillus ruminantium]USG68227.1 threonine ammonia-lyase [Brevibacillus ruminantium]
MFVTLDQIRQAQANLAGVILPTPLQYSRTFSEWSGNTVYLKPENLQKTGSFKIRGAYNKIAMLSDEEKKRGVVAFSAGNHGAGTAYAAQSLGIQATVVMPTHPVPSKRNAIIHYGAKIVDGGSTSITMHDKAKELEQTEGLVMIHPFEDIPIIAGQGTIGLEIVAELPEVDTVVVPVSGGGLISGVAAALKEVKPAVRVIGVNTEGAMAMYESLRHGYPFEVEKVDTIADGLMAKKPGELTFAHTRKYVDEMVLVSEEEIAKTVVSLAERAKLVVEPSGAAALAAMIHRRTQISGEKVVVLVTGGNVNMSLLATLIEKYT